MHVTLQLLPPLLRTLEPLLPPLLGPCLPPAAGARGPLSFRTPRLDHTLHHSHLIQSPVEMPQGPGCPRPLWPPLPGDNVAPGWEPLLFQDHVGHCRMLTRTQPPRGLAEGCMGPPTSTPRWGHRAMSSTVHARLGWSPRPPTARALMLSGKLTAAPPSGGSCLPVLCPQHRPPLPCQCRGGPHSLALPRVSGHGAKEQGGWGDSRERPHSRGFLGLYHHG